MAKMRAAFAAVLFAAAYALAGSVVYATGWAAVPPGEVAERADIIVTGRYDFASDMTVSEAPIFVGYAFEVERVYRGEVPRRMTAGIDFNDVAIAREFQEQGGSFLLLLEYNERYRYPVPVAGPNSMVPLSDEAVDEMAGDEERRRFFTEFLNRESPVAVYEPAASAFGLPALIVAGTAGIAAVAVYLIVRKRAPA